MASRGTGLTWPPELPFSLALERACNLERSALGMLYRRFVPVVYRYVLARVGSEPVAEDITSEVFFALLEGIRTMRAHDELGFAAWLLGIARNKVSMHFRKIRIRPEEPTPATTTPRPIGEHLRRSSKPTPCSKRKIAGILTSYEHPVVSF